VVRKKFIFTAYYWIVPGADSSVIYINKIACVTIKTELNQLN